MTVGRQSPVLRHLRQAVLAQDPGGRPDAELLASFVARRDAAALAALIRRHGPMVLAVCRRVLAHEQDAEDAFQAAFLVFVRKAASIRGREQVGNWLYGVAHRTALKARTAAARRRANERRAADMPHPSTEPEAGWEELLPLLDQELSRLPDKYRTPVVLCELEGRPRKEAARALGIPEGTLSSRLATARRMLATRLKRHGPSPSAGALAAALAHGATAAVAPPLLSSTVQVASVVAAGQAAGAASARVAALAEGVVKTMLLAKLSAVAFAAALVVVAVGSAAFAFRAGAEEPAPPAKAAPAVLPAKSAAADNPEPKKVDDEWGEAVEGVQARLRPTKTHWDAGEAVDFVLDVRNKGEKAHGGCRVRNFCEIEWDGKWYQFGGSGELDCKSYSLEPGKQVDEWVKASPDIPWVQKPDPKPSDPPTLGGVVLWRLRVEPGKHTVRVGFRFDDGARPVSRPVEIEIGKESDWGKADGGVQARVRTPKAAWKEGEAPRFSLDLRNQGKDTPDARRVALDCQIEVDGVWYSYDKPSGPYPAVGSSLEPGKQVDDWASVAPDKNWGSLDGKRAHFSLPSGKHTIRVAYPLQGVAPAIKPVSGPVEIVVGTDKDSGWGEPSEGVQARLRTTKVVWGAKETPTFILDLRNRGKRTPHAMPIAFKCEIEVDGTWYHYQGLYAIKIEDKALEPGKEIDDWLEVAPTNSWVWKPPEPAAGPYPPLALAPGKHTIRLVFPFAEEAPAIRPVSGPIEIEVRTEPEWGEAVDGVQARLRPSKTAWDAGENPEFTLDLRNRGKNTHALCRSPAYCRIEVDGEPYIQAVAAVVKYETTPLKPGDEVRGWLTFRPNSYFPRMPGGFPGTPNDDEECLTTSAGKHTMRAFLGFDVGDPPGVVPSQPVEFEIGKQSDWGKDDGGIQARVRTPKAVWAPKETPKFLVDLQNVGDRTPHSLHIPFDCEIELDGTWYAYTGPVDVTSQDTKLEPGKHYKEWVRVTPDYLWQERAPAGRKPRMLLPPSPGKHTIRIAYPINGEKPPPRPVSGPIEIEVRKDSAGEQGADGKEEPQPLVKPTQGPGRVPFLPPDAPAPPRPSDPPSVP